MTTPPPFPMRFAITRERLASMVFRLMVDEHDLPPGIYEHRLVTLAEDDPENGPDSERAPGFVLEVTGYRREGG